jgi:hypothetical protein
VSTLGIVDRKRSKTNNLKSEEEAKAQIMLWFDSEPERADISEDKKEEMLSIIAKELWSKIKSKNASHSELPSADIKASKSSNGTTPK